MKKQSEVSIFDSDLKKLESEFVWHHAKSPDLKAKLLKDMNKIELRKKVTIPLGILLRISAVGALLLIVFIIGKHELIVNQDAKTGSGTESIEHYLLKQEQANQDTKVTYTASEQNQFEGLDGNEAKIPLTIDSSIPRDLRDDVEFISGEPEITVSKSDGQLFAEATYPLFNGESITVKAIENLYGSINEIKKVLEPTKLKSEKISISHLDALLFENGDKAQSELLLITEGNLYVIKGGNEDSALIKVAEQIELSK
ncbi:hypothetical protein [Metabacillus malikii]|uniref:DUF4367 domain-containing protein n=1 Tax=Metabacillus malikii TaxID=1504265 RepID=A0ABT9ZK60_9BACI|nr:hypothetical protein [Metabacillus malikii]MDQ0232643.1 hypothetical protein [Metabacillus malikii]